jgi:hypothetical protein
MEIHFDPNDHTFRSPDFMRVIDQAFTFFVNSPVHNLPPSTFFGGAGVYALYYVGDFEPYSAISQSNATGFNKPVYAGKAVPPGWRQGRNIGVSVTASTLFNRLRQHSASIQSALNLNLSDFRCRFMILEGQESNLISTVESELIRRFTPLWNSVIDGFGNHDPGSGRYNQRPSEWDILHPGRVWAGRLSGKAPILSEILARIKANS